MEIQEIRAEMQEQSRIAAKLNELRIQQQKLRETESMLRAIRSREERDVERLEGGSLTALFYGMTGKKPEKLDKEQREAYEAAVRHDTVLGELETMDYEIQQLESRKRSMNELENRLESAIRERKEWLKANCPEKAQDILDAEARIASLSGQLKEITEALDAGKSAKQTTEAIKKSLKSAEGWGTWDVLGGGLMTTMVKHSHLDEAQNQVNVLQQRLRTFRTELVDVSFDSDIQIQIDGFLRFADYFWDGIFSDWMVLGKIHDSQNQVYEVSSKIDQILGKLGTMKNQVEQELGAEKSRLERFVS